MYFNLKLFHWFIFERRGAGNYLILRIYGSMMRCFFSDCLFDNAEYIEQFLYLECNFPQTITGSEPSGLEGRNPAGPDVHGPAVDARGVARLLSAQVSSEVSFELQRRADKKS